MHEFCSAAIIIMHCQQITALIMNSCKVNEPSIAQGCLLVPCSSPLEVLTIKTESLDKKKKFHLSLR